MDPMSESLTAVESHFSRQLERREAVLKGSRDVISACSRAIINVHTRKLKEAAEELSRAKVMLASLKKYEPGVARYLVSPETEYVEASAVLSLAKGRPIPSIKSLDATPEAYLLGLLDTVGEMKRLVLDSVMEDKPEKAVRYFHVMEEIYSACSPLAVYDHVANGARRKIDVARMLVEDTRGLMTEEAGRRAVGSSLARLERKLKTKG
jgi:translin